MESIREKLLQRSNTFKLCYLGLLFSIVSGVALCSAFLLQGVIVASGSMEPALMTGELCLISKVSYLFHDPKRGDIISFYDPGSGEYFGKRVIGIPGDTITFRDGYVLINGLLADESAYLTPETETNCTKIIQVPENSVFVLGDNRSNSVDSRFWEDPFVSFDNIVGKYICCVPSVGEILMMRENTSPKGLVRKEYHVSYPKSSMLLSFPSDQVLEITGELENIVPRLLTLGAVFLLLLAPFHLHMTKKRMLALIRAREVLAGSQTLPPEQTEKKAATPFRKILAVLFVILILSGTLFATIRQVRDFSSTEDTPEQNSLSEALLYRFVEISDTATVSAINQMTGSIDDIEVKLQSVNTVSQTETYLQQFLNSGQAYYTRHDPPAGTHWESVTYQIRPEPCSVHYTDFRVFGPDGTALSVDGVFLEERCFDIWMNVAPDPDASGWENNYIVYYAIPDGCTEYILSCGEHTPGGYGMNAYFSIRKGTGK